MTTPERWEKKYQATRREQLDPLIPNNFIFKNSEEDFKFLSSLMEEFIDLGNGNGGTRNFLYMDCEEKNLSYIIYPQKIPTQENYVKDVIIQNQRDKTPEKIVEILTSHGFIKKEGSLTIAELEERL